VGLLVLKCTLVPALVAAVSLAARRWGPRVAGLLTAFPIVTGPALLFLAAEQGARFAAEAARGALAALLAVAASALAYAWAARRGPWWVSLPASWAAFVAGTVPLERARPPVGLALAAALAGFWALPRLLPAATGRAALPAPGAWDLPLRMVSAMALVLAVTGLAERLGPGWTGAFTPFPVALTVLLASTHAREGPAAVVRFLRGFATGMWSFAAFCFVAAVSLAPLGGTGGLLLATALALAVQVAVLWWTEGRTAGRPAD
jgi:hypothetical protein